MFYSDAIEEAFLVPKYKEPGLHDAIKKTLKFKIGGQKNAPECFFFCVCVIFILYDIV